MRQALTHHFTSLIISIDQLSYTAATAVHRCVSENCSEKFRKIHRKNVRTSVSPL